MMDLPEQITQSRPQTPESVNESSISQEQEHKSFLQLFTEENEKFVKQKMRDEWVIKTTQIKLKDFESINEKQKELIQKYQGSIKALENMLTGEKTSRSLITEQTEKIQKNMDTYVNLYNQINMRYQSCEKTKKDLAQSYKLSLEKLEKLNQEVYMLKNCNDVKIESLKTVLQNWKDQYEHMMIQNKTNLEKKDADIASLNETVKKLQVINIESDKKNYQLMFELRSAINEKDELINNLMEMKDKHSTLIKEYEQEKMRYSTEESALKVILCESNDSYKKLELEYTEMQSALKKQDNFMNEIQMRNTHLDNTISDLEQKNNSLSNKICEIQIQLKQEQETFEQKSIIADNQIKQSVKKIQELEAEKTQLNQRLNLTEEEVAKQIIKITQLMNDVNTLTDNVQTNLNQHNEEVSSLNAKIQELQEEIMRNSDLEQQLKLQTRIVNEQYATLQKDFESQTINYVKQEAELKTQLENMMNQNEMLEVKIHSLEEKFKALEKEYEEKLKNLENESEIKLQQMKEQGHLYKYEIDKVRNTERDKYKKEIEGLNEQLKLLRFEINEVVISKKYLESELKAAREAKQLSDESREKEITHNQSSRTVHKQKIMSIPRRLPPKPKIWDDSASDSSYDISLSELEHLSRKESIKNRSVVTKRETSSSSKPNLSPKNKKICPDLSQASMDEVFDSLRDPSFRLPTPRKQVKSKKSSKK